LNLMQYDRYPHQHTTEFLAKDQDHLGFAGIQRDKKDVSCKSCRHVLEYQEIPLFYLAEYDSGIP